MGWLRLRLGGRQQRARVLLLAIGAMVIGLTVAAYSTELFKALEGNTVDARFSVRGGEPPPDNVVLVKVDAETFDDLGLQWPFPRAVIGRVVRRVSEQQPAAIAIDIQLSETSRDGQKDDIALLEEITDSRRKTVFASTETDRRGRVRFLGSAKGTLLLEQVGSRPASGLFSTDPGDYIRRIEYEINALRTLGVVAAEIAAEKPVPRSDFPEQDAWIDFAGPGGTIRSISFGRVHGCPECEPPPPGFFKDKVVVIGATAPVLQDIHPTSTDSSMSGPEAQANAIATVQRGFPLTSVPGFANILVIVVLGVAAPLLSMRFGPLVTTGVTVALGGAFLVGAQLAFNGGKVVAVVYPLGALILAYGGSLVVQLMTEAFERVRTRDLFSRFVPENVVDEVLASADGFRLGGVQRDGTVMFVDLRGFTSLAETLTPARVIDTLNHYLGEMSDAILNHGGTLVAYMGDGIMAVFGAPLVQEDHADRALAAAREMLTVRLPRFNDWLRSEDLSEGFKMGIGLNSGHVMSGHVGSERRVEYTAVGDTTNTAARIEALTKGTDHMLLLSDATKAALRTPADDLEFVKETEIRGRVARIKLWSVKAAKTDAEPAVTPAQAPT